MQESVDPTVSILERVVVIVKYMHLLSFNTPCGVLNYSPPEVTALELVGYPRHAGGLNNAATVLYDLSEEIVSDKLIEAVRLSPVSWSQRLGYLLELVDHFNDLGVTARYHYDYGDDWVHTVMLEGYIFRKKEQEFPCCTGGARACPVEDCGGPPGYMDMIEILSDPETEEMTVASLPISIKASTDTGFS